MLSIGLTMIHKFTNISLHVCVFDLLRPVSKIISLQSTIEIVVPIFIKSLVFTANDLL